MKIKEIFFFKKKKIYLKQCFDLKPTKSLVRNFFFSLLTKFVSDLYSLDCFCGSCVFGIKLYFLNAKKVTNIDISTKHIFYCYTNISRFNISLNHNFKLLNLDSFNWLKMFDILNFSLLIFDPPYRLLNIHMYFLLINKIFFTRKCLFFYFETDCFKFFDFFLIDLFLIRKKIIGNVKFFLFKKI